ncbi:hypothetical protein pphageT12_10 [Pseudomonas phage pphageT12]|uniref:Uncharacterized protein n=1 Tax=Pseudomonas phage phiB1_1 TaxID=2755402 RepID=A0A7D7JKN0_9CAUD|nr:hypothetical protein phiB1_1_06 [Pseudomonas phage phiB1_1]UAW53643.1 hypothetical protein pphageB21_10 [Pseudomonas phage pphageB21]UAW53702.1 hypothetical protein pphageT21_10 [Pseudomonas phage pphageT21]UAW53761.1 hypothetical protein pphageT12_10 [Pseudomonas phage pphageT12]UAW53822.1 hypothetical protein pphageBV72_10 [Pseudomonas phage pphageBV72]
MPAIANTPAFVVLNLQLNDRQGERAALRGAGLTNYIMCSTGGDRKVVYAVPAEDMYCTQRRDGILDMLSTLMVREVLHVDEKRQARYCPADNNYLPIGVWVAGQWVECNQDIHEHAFRIKGRAFRVDPEVQNVKAIACRV